LRNAAAEILKSGKLPAGGLSDAIKPCLSGVVGESTVLKWAVFIAVDTVKCGLQSETTPTGTLIN
jgi:hypothetical protein